MESAETSNVTQAKPELPTFGRERPTPGAYNLDLSAVKNSPLEVNGQLSSFEEVYRTLQSAKDLKVPDFHWGRPTFETDIGEVTVCAQSGELFVVYVLVELAELLKDGIDPYRATWFFYDHDTSCDGDPLYTFFVVHEGKIVREISSFGSSEPLVLKKRVEDRPIWRSEPYMQEAWEAYWYRKFYTETFRGQLMVLRPDEPTLYHYDRAPRDVTRDLEFATLIKIYRLLWVAVPLLAAIAFPMLRPYMAGLAVTCAALWVWSWWASFKAGR